MPWKAIKERQSTTLGCVQWNNKERFHRYIGDVPSEELEEKFYAENRQTKALEKTQFWNLYKTQDGSAERFAAASGFRGSQNKN